MEIKLCKTNKVTVVFTCSQYDVGINGFKEYEETVVFFDCGKKMILKGHEWRVLNEVQLQIGNKLTVEYVNRGDVRYFYGNVKSFKVE